MQSVRVWGRRATKSLQLTQSGFSEAERRLQGTHTKLVVQLSNHSILWAFNTVIIYSQFHQIQIND